MSAEVESKKEEEKPEPPKQLLLYRILRFWQVGFKLLELVLAAVCMGFIYDPISTSVLSNEKLHQVGVMYTAYTGSMVIIIGLIIGRVLKDRLGYRTSFIFSTVSAALYLATGILLTAEKVDLTKNTFFHPRRYLLNMMTASIVATFLNAIVFIGDAIATFVYKQDF